MFFILLRSWDEKKILSLHEEQNRRPAYCQDSEFFLCSTLVARRKKSFSISLPSSKLTNLSYFVYNYDTIDIADPSSMQDACHMKFEIDFAHRGVPVAQW